MLKSGAKYFCCFISFFLLIAHSACNQKNNYKSPDGYIFATPEKYVLPERLKEISGITFTNSNAVRLYAINDEDGRLFNFNPAEKNYAFSKFSGHGDYEDLAILNNNNFVVLRSDGSLFAFALPGETVNDIAPVQEYLQLLPNGEYEGIASEENSVFVLCKHCPGDKKKPQVTVYEVGFVDGAAPKIINTHIVDVSSSGIKRHFSPSAISKNPITGEWYILSSVDKLLIVLDSAWKLKDAFPIDPAIFRQPEGMTFGTNGDLYISNEAGGGSANILLFRYKGR